MNMQDAIGLVTEGQNLTTEQMAAVMNIIMTGEATDAQIGGFLIGLRMKGETIEEITGAAQAMRALATPVTIDNPNIVDIVGTGGDGAKLFNVSTASSFVVAAAGGHVAKHGNRSVSSSSGAADLLEAAGVKLDVTPEQVARCVNEVGVGFMFALNHHSAMKHAIGPRKEMAVRTIFNILGPLTNPAGAPNMLLGVFSPALVRPMAEVLQRLGANHVLVVHSADGLDEISIAAETQVAELKDGAITEYRISPEQFGFQRAEDLSSVQVNDAEESLALVKQALGKGESVAGDMVALNAGAAIYAAGIADSLEEGVVRAQDAIASGIAKEKIGELASFTSVFE